MNYYFVLPQQGNNLCVYYIIIAASFLRVINLERLILSIWHRIGEPMEFITTHVCCAFPIFSCGFLWRTECLFFG